MICYTMVSLFCNEDISLIENYEQAATDIIQTWHCHHRLEIQDNIILSKNDLIRQNLYFNRPASELIFLTKSEHMQLHAKNRSKQTRKLIADSKAIINFISFAPTIEPYFLIASLLSLQFFSTCFVEYINFICLLLSIIHFTKKVI